MTVEMQRLQVIGLKGDLLPVIRQLHTLGCVEISKVDVSDEQGLSRLEIEPEALQSEEDIRLTLSHIRGILDELDVEGHSPADPAGTVSVAEIKATVTRLKRQLEGLLNQREQLHSEQDLLPNLIDTLRQLLPLMSAGNTHQNFAWIGLLVNRSHQHMLQTIEELIAAETDQQAEIVSGEIDDTTAAMLIATPRHTLSEVSDLLEEEDVSRLRLPPDIQYDAPDTAVASLRKRLDQIPAELDTISQELDQMRTRWADVLWLWQDVLSDELDRREVLDKLAATERTFVLKGWIPTRDVDALQSLVKVAHNRLMIDTRPASPETDEDIPVVLDNLPPAQPFEGLVTFLSRPRYEGIDPTTLMALFLPLLFGMILGDAGYGAVLLAASLYARSKLNEGMGRALSSVLAFGAGWAIVFGILFGEVFGTLGEQLGLHPILFHRDDPAHLLDLLLMTVGVGAVHVVLGLVIGVIKGIRENDRHELMERGGQLIGLVALLLLVGVLADLLPGALMTVAIAGLIVGLVILIASLGWTGIAIAPVELIGLVGNILSYLRIAAIGLASVYLAVVANRIAGAVGSLIVGIIVAVLLHALNIVLGAFSPTIHSLRLHYVEFFGQFYDGGGRAFEPFEARAGSAITLEP